MLQSTGAFYRSHWASPMIRKVLDRLCMGEHVQTSRSSSVMGDVEAECSTQSQLDIP